MPLGGRIYNRCPTRARLLANHVVFPFFFPREPIELGRGSRLRIGADLDDAIVTNRHPIGRLKLVEIVLGDHQNWETGVVQFVGDDRS